jgi:hypothetical protein
VRALTDTPSRLQPRQLPDRHTVPSEQRGVPTPRHDSAYESPKNVGKSQPNVQECGRNTSVTEVVLLLELDTAQQPRELGVLGTALHQRPRPIGLLRHEGEGRGRGGGG